MEQYCICLHALHFRVCANLSPPHHSCAEASRLMIAHECSSRHLTSICRILHHLRLLRAVSARAHEIVVTSSIALHAASLRHDAHLLRVIVSVWSLMMVVTCRSSAASHIHLIIIEVIVVVALVIPAAIISVVIVSIASLA